MGIDAKYGKVTLENPPKSLIESEPLFVLRAADALAVQTIARYRNFADSIEEKTKPPHSWFEALDKVIADFAAWQQKHASRVKVPD